MSRSVHKTVSQTARDNSKLELQDPDNADIAELARKHRYKNAKRDERSKQTESDIAAGTADPRRN